MWCLGYYVVSYLTCQNLLAFLLELYFLTSFTSIWVSILRHSTLQEKRDVFIHTFDYYIYTLVVHQNVQHCWTPQRFYYPTWYSSSPILCGKINQKILLVDFSDHIFWWNINQNLHTHEGLKMPRTKLNSHCAYQSSTSIINPRNVPLLVYPFT